MSKEIVTLDAGKYGEAAIFRVIWNTVPRKSFVSGIFLRQYENTEFYYSCFAHVLAKGQNKYPHFRHLAQNIVLLTPDEHHLLDHATEEQRIGYALDLEERTGGKSTADWDKLKRLENELKELYKKYFPSTRFGILNYTYDRDEVTEVVGSLNRAYFESLTKK